LPEEWKKFILTPIYKDGDKTDCSNYGGISLLSYTWRFIMYSEIITIYDRKTLGHVFTNPVQIEDNSWSLTLKEERRLRVFENRVLWKIFGPIHK
jgi:hypothetical protein